MAKKRRSFIQALYRFVWGPEVELGDCIFYTILTLVLMGLIWLFTFERIGIHVGFVLIPWAALVYAIWHQYKKTRPDDELTQKSDDDRRKHHGKS